MDSGRVQVEEYHPSKHLTADLLSCQSWLWLLPPPCTLQSPSSQPLCPNSGKQKLISSVKAEAIDLPRPTRRILIRAGFAFSSLSLQSMGSKARTQRRRDRGKPYRTDRSIAKDPEHCSTECWSICGALVWIRRSPKPQLKTDGPPYQRLWTYLNWSALLQCRLLFPLESRWPSSRYLGLIFTSQRYSAQVRLNH